MARMEWEDGEAWWDYRDFMNQRTMDMWVPKSIALMIPIPAAESEDGLSYYELDPDKASEMHEAAKELIILQTRAWSFGDVTLDVLDTEIRPEYLNEMANIIAGVVPPLAAMNERTMRTASFTHYVEGDPSP